MNKLINISTTQTILYTLLVFLIILAQPLFNSRFLNHLYDSSYYLPTVAFMVLGALVFWKLRNSKKHPDFISAIKVFTVATIVMYFPYTSYILYEKTALVYLLFYFIIITILVITSRFHKDNILGWKYFLTTPLSTFNIAFIIATPFIMATLIPFGGGFEIGLIFISIIMIMVIGKYCLENYFLVFFFIILFIVFLNGLGTLILVSMLMMVPITVFFIIGGICEFMFQRSIKASKK